MPNTPSEQIRECLAHVEECARKAAAQSNPTLKQDFLDMGWRWLALAKITAAKHISRSSRYLLQRPSYPRQRRRITIQRR